jgi:hypothetical protein
MHMSLEDAQAQAEREFRVRPDEWPPPTDS